MGTGGMSTNVKAIRIPIETRSIPVNPRDRAADLLGHNSEIAFRCPRLDKVNCNVVSACLDEHFRCKTNYCSLNLIAKHRHV